MTMTDPMDVDDAPAAVTIIAATVSPQDESFLDSLKEPLKSLAQEALDTSKTPLARADGLEIQLRSHLLQLTTNLLQDPSNASKRIEVEEYWKSCLDTCLHLVHFSQKNSANYKGMGAAAVRKLPFVLLEDVVETLPLHLVQQVWTSTVESSINKKLCGDLLWVKTSHLVWIRVCNKLLKKIHGGEWAGRILLSLAAVFPLSERSAMNVLGSFHTENVTNYESLDEFQAHSKVEEEENEDTEDTMRVEENDEKKKEDYAFYETFWSIQQDFSNPIAVDLQQFQKRMQAILAVLESHSFETQSRKTSPATASCTNTGHSSKYLTNSQLLHLQLRDPELRIHFLTQYLIVESFLRDKLSQLQQKSMDKVTKRAKDLLRHTPPRGKAHLQTIQWLLEERESMWRKWKRNKCTPDLEKKASSSVAAKKKKTLGGALGSTCKEDEENLFHFTVDVKKDMPQISRDMANVVPELHAHLEEYVEALDPEAGIESEYHPKNDKLFSWRAMRLLSRSHLGLFDRVRRRDGDFEGLVRHIYKTECDTDIPGDAPEAEPFEEFEEEKQEMNGHDAEAHESSDVDDDVSVGSPMDTEDIKEEQSEDGEAAASSNIKASEFAKAALEEEKEMMKQEEEKPKETGAAKEEPKESGSGAIKKETVVVKKEEEKKAKEDDKASSSKREEPSRSVPAKKEEQASGHKRVEPATGSKREEPKREEPSRSVPAKKEQQASGHKRVEPATGSKREEPNRPPPTKKEEKIRTDNRDSKPVSREGDRRGGGGGRRGRSPPIRNSPDRGGRRSPDRARGRDDHGRQGRDGGGGVRRDRHDGGGGGRDDHRRGRSQDDRGGKRRRQVGGGRRSY